MDQRVEEISRRPLYVYDLPQDLLSTLQRHVDDGEDEHKNNDVQSQIVIRGDRGIDLSAGNSTACSLCSLTFSGVEEQRSHTRSDMHRYNLKQKLGRLPVVSESEFEKLVEDLNESLSGSETSDSEDEEENCQGATLGTLLKKQAAKKRNNTGNQGDIVPKKKRGGSGTPPLIWFTTTLLPPNVRLGIYRALLTVSEIEGEALTEDVIRKKQLSPNGVSKDRPEKNAMKSSHNMSSEPHVFLCMIGGGHFAAMVVSLAPRQTWSPSAGPLSREVVVLAHKTFHRYTTRRKQGGSQSASDSAKGTAHSAGSSLRRYNEAALMDEVRLLLSDWKELIESSELLFVRATGNTNRRILFGPYDGQVLRQNDPRLRGFPFSTRRATQNELMHSFLELTQLKIQKIAEVPAGSEVPAGENLKPSKKTPQIVNKLSEKQEIVLHHTAQIQALIRRSKLPALLSYFKANNLSSDFRFFPEDSQQNYHASTPLHLATSQNSPTIVLGLLMKGGANPTSMNGDSKPAFDLAGDRATRDAFRVARSSLGDLRWDWEAAHVPLGLSKSEADRRDEREQQEMTQKEEERRRAELDRLQLEGPVVGNSSPLVNALSNSRASALGHLQKTAKEKREEESRGLSPEMRAKLERERRARAAEERIKRL